ncbi:MAG: hypothetical protein HY553_07365 [Elusimicrobia bacterium]|nr:hypothetical protein [Elusimicrobiota bacterium]
MKALLLAAAWLAGGALSQEASPVEEKLRLERETTRRVAEALDAYLGPGRSHVSVSLGLSVVRLPGPNALADAPAPIAPRPRPGEPESSPQLQTRWLWRDIARKPRVAVLPGFAVAPEVSVVDRRERPPEAKAGEPPKAPEPSSGAGDLAVEVRGMKVAVLLDASATAAQAKEAEAIAAHVSGMDAGRGDELQVRRVPLAPLWRQALLRPSVLLRVVWIALAVLALSLLAWRAARAATQVLRTLGLLPRQAAEPPELKGGAGEPKPAAADPSEPRQVAEPPEDGAADAGSAPAVAPDDEGFAFVKPEQAALLAELLEGRDAAEAIAVIGLLAPGLAARVLEATRAERRVELLYHLSWARSSDRTSLESLRAQWKERLETAYGGSQRAAELLSGLEPPLQSHVLSQLQARAPEVARRVRRALVRFEDLFELPPAELGLLGQAAPYEQWAAALVGIDDARARKLVDALPRAAQAALEQWRSLSGARGAQVALARAKVLAVARALRREGKLPGLDAWAGG